MGKAQALTRFLALSIPIQVAGMYVQYVPKFVQLPYRIIQEELEQTSQHRNTSCFLESTEQPMCMWDMSNSPVYIHEISSFR